MSGLFENFSDETRKILAFANQEAQRFNHEYIDIIHIMLGIVRSPDKEMVAAKAFAAVGIDLRKIRLEIEKLTKSGPDLITMGKLPFTSQAKQALENAKEIAKVRNSPEVYSEHLLLGLSQAVSQARKAGDMTIASTVFSNLNLEIPTFEKAIDSLIDEKKKQEEEKLRRPRRQWIIDPIEKIEVKRVTLHANPLIERFDCLVLYADNKASYERTFKTEDEVWAFYFGLEAGMGGLHILPRLKIPDPSLKALI